MSEPEHIGTDGTVRKSHGRQPWDDIIDAGCGPEFAFGNALKYVRRYDKKNGEDDLTKGRWYYARLVEMARGEGSLPKTPAFAGKMGQGRAIYLLKQLQGMLTEAERQLLRRGEI